MGMKRLPTCLPLKEVLQKASYGRSTFSKSSSAGLLWPKDHQPFIYGENSSIRPLSRDLLRKGENFQQVFHGKENLQQVFNGERTFSGNFIERRHSAGLLWKEEREDLQTVHISQGEKTFNRPFVEEDFQQVCVQTF